MKIEGKDAKKAVARITGMIIARIGGSDPPITAAVGKADEIVRAVLKTQIKCEHVYEVAEIAGTIFAESSEQDLSNQARLANSIQWATQIAKLTGIH
jgi:hypothetical protein